MVTAPARTRPPRQKFRWCTERLKIRPSNKFIRDMVRQYGEAILVLGTRKAESQARGVRMLRLEARRVRERLSPNVGLPNSLVYIPIEDWSNDDVWLYLMQVKNPWGHDNKSLLGMYQGASEGGECPLVVDSSTPSCGSSRFGCWVCTVVEKDRSMEAMITNDEEKVWMTPLQLRNELDRPDDRDRRDFRRMNGRIQLMGDKVIPGPYTKEWREHWLRRVLQAQETARQEGPPEFRNLQLITPAELQEIRRLWLYDKHEFDDSLPRIAALARRASEGGPSLARRANSDGEKIRSLAEDSTSSAALGAAIKTLLGLDLVERLIADALVLQTRLAREAAPSELQAHATELEEQFNALQSQVQVLVTERASLENHVRRAQAEMAEAEEQFATAGGKHWEERQTRGERVQELRTVAGELEDRLLALSAGELPLVLVHDLLARVEQQDERERVAGEAEVVHRLLVERDRQLLDVLRTARASQGLVQQVSKHLDHDRQARLPSGEVNRRLLLSEGARSALHHLRRQRLGELAEEVRVLLDKLAQVVQERDDLERALAATPSEADLASVVERVKAAAQDLATLTGQAAQLDGQIKARRAEQEDVRKKLERLWQGKVKEEAERDDRQRMIELAGRTRDTMQQFLHDATARKIDRLSRLIIESFRFLLRKQTLVEQIHIDPADFALTLYDAAGKALSRQRLSEGEKQIFAVAMLWGLARASARPLPAVIDTPMARLDAAHREHLVERYFPNASHQVLVFSTDTEVDRHYYELLRPAVARAYHLRYSEPERVTVGEEGYFWQE